MVHKTGGHGNIFLDLGLDRGKLEEESKDVCKRLLPDWNKLCSKNIQVTEISGGITNILWKLEPAEKAGLAPVVLRIFGKQTDRIIDREKEQAALRHLNKAGFGAQVLATFENGRIEAFLRMRPLKPEEMVGQRAAASIARRLKQMHGVDCGDTPAEPALFPTIQKWLRQARGLDFGDDARKAEAHAAIDFDAWQAELDAVQAAAERLRPDPCFAHNDLLSGNVMIPEGKDPESTTAADIQFIDFEYSDHTYRAFDIANHFNEYAGFECDYSRFPVHDHIQRFVTDYLEEGAAEPVVPGRRMLAQGGAAVRKGVAECYLMALASHQFWGTWAVLQAAYSPIDFDYIAYQKLRWDEYFRRRDEFMARAKAA